MLHSSLIYTHLSLIKFFRDLDIFSHFSVAAFFSPGSNCGGNTRQRPSRFITMGSFNFCFCNRFVICLIQGHSILHRSFRGCNLLKYVYFQSSGPVPPGTRLPRVLGLGVIHLSIVNLLCTCLSGAASDNQILRWVRTIVTNIRSPSPPTASKVLAPTGTA